MNEFDGNVVDWPHWNAYLYLSNKKMVEKKLLMTDEYTVY